jgi:hypothetical protein
VHQAHISLTRRDGTRPYISHCDLIKMVKKDSGFQHSASRKLRHGASSMSQPPPAPSFPPPAINFATEWLDEHGCICPKAVDYATQCPKGHALDALSDRGSAAPAQQILCRVCHVLTERERASQWLVCSVAGCCAGYAVCQCCASALQQAPAPAAAAGGDEFPSLVRQSDVYLARDWHYAMADCSDGVLRRVLLCCT